MSFTMIVVNYESDTLINWFLPISSNQSLYFNRQKTIQKLYIRTKKALEGICMKHCSPFYSGAIHHSWGKRES